MRFMLLMIPKGYEKAAPGAMPDAKAVATMMKYNESLQVQEFSDFTPEVQKAARSYPDIQKTTGR